MQYVHYKQIIDCHASHPAIRNISRQRPRLIFLFFTILHDVSRVTAAFQVLMAETARFMKTGLIGFVIV